MNYGYNKEISIDFDEAIDKIKYLLKENGFGVLSEINVSEKIQDSLGKNIERYVILGACSPDFAYQAIKSEKEVGLLLPCNIIVYIEDSKTFVSTILPTSMLSLIENENLQQVSNKVEPILKKVIDSI